MKRYPARRRRMAVAAVATAMVLAGCAESAASGGGSGESVEFGASPEEFEAALADMEPVTLTIPAFGPKGASHSAAPSEAYAERVTEYSGGKITVNVEYSASIVESGDAIADGRYSMGLSLPSAEPDRYAANNDLTAIAFGGPRTSVVGTMTTVAALTETSVNSEEMMSELEENGLVPIAPSTRAIATTGIACKKPLSSKADFEGAQVRPGSQGQVPILQALGATPVAVSYSEQYEALQRGVIDCVVIALSPLDASGSVEVAHNYVLPQGDEGVGFAGGPAAFVVNPQVWENLPLAGRQLLFDSFGIFLQTSLEGDLATDAAVSSKMQDLGGTVTSFDTTATDAIRSANEATVEGVRSSSNLDGDELVTRYHDSVDKWTGLITDELGYTEDPSLAELPAWYETNKASFSFEPWTEAFMEEVMLPHRPS